MRASVLAACLAVAAAAGSARADTVVVYILEHDFSINQSPGPIEDAVIRVGDTVRWVLTTGFHTTTSCAGIAEQWDSDFMFDVGDTYEHTFTNEGVFNYYCGIHGFDFGNGTAGGMSGRITVLPAPHCIADFNHSGGTPDDADVAAFFAAWNAGDDSADVNGSGGTPDDADVTFFFMHWNEGC